ncbi:MAG TPA: dihydrodipicolinate synthase family protein [Chloroflexota bacterium]|nr:dihydrodipicolinate synthase family protein [Chloroflexota bacterium]
MPQQHWRGIFTIPCTPFDDQGVLDEASLRREVNFCVEAGAHGVVAPVNASEFWTLTDDERLRLAEIIVQEVGGRVPVVIGAAGSSDPHAVMFARHAQSIGADAVIAMPPYVRLVSQQDIFAYYRALSDAITIPIFIQNHDAPAGTRLSPEACAKLIQELPHVDWIKEETFPPTRAIEAEVRLCGPKLKGVMGGVAGKYVIEEWRRGACGNMPACEMTDIAVQVWNALDGGDLPKARAVFIRLLPILNYEALLPGVYKAILKRRGVIASDYLRSHHGNPLGKAEHEDLTAMFAEMQDLFKLWPPT